MKFGYHVGKFQYPSETLKDARLSAKFNSKTGFLGTGHYFFGDRETAEDYLKFQKQSISGSDTDINKFNLGKYRLYRPSDASDFVDSLRITTINLFHLEGEDLVEEIKEAAEDLKSYADKDVKEITKILVQFTKDIKSQNPKDNRQLSNRLLDNYDGIDLTGTEKDHFGTGSIIFSS